MDRHGVLPQMRALPGVLLLLLLAGCAYPELVWRQADDMVLGRAREWLDLQPAQETRLQERLQPWLREVRRENLGTYAEYLEELADRITVSLDENDARWADHRFRQLYNEAVESFLPVISPTLANLEARQHKHLAQRFRESNEHYRKRFIEGRDSGRYAIAEDMIDAVELWTGPLDTTQRSLVHEHASGFPAANSLWLNYRAQRQKELLQQMAADATTQELERTIRRGWIEHADRSPETVAHGQALRDAMRAALVSLAQHLSPAQRAEARRRLRERAADLRALVDTAERPDTVPD